MALSNLPRVEYFNVTMPAPYVAHVEINRPKKLNAFCLAMWGEMKAIFDHLSHRDDVRCVLLSGAGDRAFTAGLDVEQAAQPGGALSPGSKDPSRKATEMRRHILELQDAVTAVARCEKPVVALMHGYTFGLGIDISSACDVRFCAADTKMCVKEVDIGTVADVGTLSRLPKVVGITSWVKEVAFSARTFSADEAYHNNFVSRVVKGGKPELMQEGLDYAKLVAGKSPVAVQGTKNVLDAAWGRTIEDNLNYTAVWNSAMAQSSDFQRAITSSLRRKTPTFEKL